MTDKNEKLSRLLAEIRFVYILLYMILITVSSLTPLRAIFDGRPEIAVAYAVIACVGGILVAVDFFHRQVLFTTKNCLLVIAFLVACLVSTLCNLRYGFMENAKTLIWTAIQLFLLAAMDAQQPKQVHMKHLKIFAEVFCGIWTVAVCWSLGMYLVQYRGVYRFSDVAYGVRTGFTGGRLFGVFSDPNYASLNSLAAAGLAVLLLTEKGSHPLRRVYHGFGIFVQLCYIILSGSRTTHLALLGVVGLVCGFFGWLLAEKKGKKLPLRVLACLVALALGAGAMQLVFSLGKTALSYVPGLFHFQQGGTDVDPTDPSLPEDIPEDPDQIDLSRPDVGEGTDVSNGRIRIWSDYVQVFLKTPIVGTSPRNANRYVMENFEGLFINDRPYSVHNGYLALFVCTGILGAVPMLLWLVLVAVEVVGYLIRRRNDRDEFYRPVFVMTAILVVLAVGALPLMYLFFSNLIIDLLFWVVLGYTLGFIRMSEPERFQKQSLPMKLTRKLLRKKEND